MWAVRVRQFMQSYVTAQDKPQACAGNSLLLPVLTRIRRVETLRSCLRVMNIQGDSKLMHRLNANI
jgi:hypothetical protein